MLEPVRGILTKFSCFVGSFELVSSGGFASALAASVGLPTQRRHSVLVELVENPINLSHPGDLLFPQTKI
jgi:hypothetical protein